MSTNKRTITIEVTETVYGLLAVLDTRGTPPNVERVVLDLIDHAQQGVYRPGAWEREWILQAFGYDWLGRMEPGDPYGRTDCEKLFERPRQAPPAGDGKPR